MEKNHHSFRKICLSVVLVLAFLSLQAQHSKYMVFFSDKDTVLYTYDHPEVYLSPKAVDRRERFDIPLHFSDLPVNPKYVQTLSDAGASVIYTSRWFNAALVECADSTLEQITSLTFVHDSELVKPAGRGRSRKSGASAGNTMRSARTFKAGELLNNLQNQMLGIDLMHDAGYHGEGISVAVFDGGFLGVDTSPFFQHLFDNQQIIPGYDFVGNSPDVFRYGQHGTEALSCIAAYAPGVLEAGAYAAKVMLCVTEESGSEYRIEEYNWLFAAERADSAGVDIISTSLGYTTFDDSAMNYSFSDLDGKTAAITRAVNMATSKGMVCVISAGNEGAGYWKYISPPADAPDVLAVGAVSAQGVRVPFSSYGPTADGRIKPDVSAMGLQTVVVNAQGNVTTSNGTSFSAPLITGFLAGVWQAYPELNNIEVVEKVKQAGSQALSPDNEMGYGIPDFERILEGITPLPQEQTPHLYQVFPNPVEEGKIFIESPEGYFKGSVGLVLYSSTGQKLMEQQMARVDEAVISLDTRNLEQGVYILHILSPDITDTFKVVKF